jgi:hypothetical protein
MTADPPTWPTEHIDQELASRWVVSRCGHEVRSPEILQVKAWGVTARFENVVLKASFTPLFPQVADVHAVLERAVPGSAPLLIASELVHGQLWTLFDHVLGPTAEKMGTPDALVSTARALAAVQVAVAEQDLTRIPAIDVRLVPRLLLKDLVDQPAELVEWLHDAQPALEADAEALATIPRSLDHPDVNSSNAILCDDGRVVLLDWEEATAGCPFFSLDRLLADAHEHSAVERVMSAYLDGFPWGSQREIESALRLVPLELALENRAFARGLGWPHPHSRLTTRLLKLAQERSNWKVGDPLLHLSQIPSTTRV